jgi:hypothetical protein
MRKNITYGELPDMKVFVFSIFQPQQNAKWRVHHPNVGSDQVLNLLQEKVTGEK